MNEFSKETLEQAKSFDLIGEKYEETFGDNPYQLMAMAWLNDRIQPGNTVLDVGCGDGLLTAKPIIEAGNKLVGIDNSKEMLRLAKRNVPEGDFKLMDMRNINFENQRFDSATAFFSLIHLPKNEIKDVISSILDQIALRGFLVFSLVEGHFDNKEVIFLGQKMRISTYMIEEVRKIMSQLPVIELNVKKHMFRPKSGGFKESQLYFYYQKVKG
ncbi:MAG: class I SAM-dependent methyltransferase [Bacteroidales bacterium]